MTIYAPYFYIIQDRRNGIYYAGSKYSKKKSQRTNPIHFMTEDGYQTSSSVIRTIIDLYGLETFVIRKIKTFATPEETRHYESRFLQKVNARQNKNFYNKHNNDGYFENNNNSELMMKIYGVDNFAKSELFPERFRATCLEKYGTEHHLQNSEIMDKKKETCMQRYGSEHYLTSEEGKKRIQETMLEKYGVTRYAKTDAFKERMIEHSLKTYGVDHHSKTVERRAAHKQNQKNRFDRPIVKELQELILIAKDLEIDFSGDFGLTRFWGQRADENLESIREALSAEIQKRQDSGARKRTKRERMQDVNQKLYSRPIVTEIKKIAELSRIELGAAWWRKSDEALQELLREISHTEDCI
jgi:hypothetical protein